MSANNILNLKQGNRSVKDKLLELLEREKEKERTKAEQTSYMDPLMELQRKYSGKSTDEEAARAAIQGTGTDKKTGQTNGWQPTVKNSVPLYGADREKKLPNRMTQADKLLMNKVRGVPYGQEELRYLLMNKQQRNTLAAEKTKRNGAAVRPGSQLVGISRANERNIPLRYVDEKTTGWLDRPWYYVPVDENGNPQKSGDMMILKNDGADLASQAATEDWWRRHGQPAMENGSKAWAREETLQKNLLRYGRNYLAGQTGEEGYREEKALEWYLGTEQGQRDAQQAGSADAVRGAFKTNETYRNGIVSQWAQSQTEAARGEAREGSWREGIRADVDRESLSLIHQVEDQMDPEDVNLYRYLMEGVNYDSAYDPEQTLAGMDDGEKESFLESFRDDMTDVLTAKGYEPQTAITGTNVKAREAAQAEGEQADLMRAENWRGYSVQLMDDIIDMAESGKLTDALMGWNQAMRDNQQELERLYGLKASGSNAFTGYWADDRNARDDVQDKIDILENEQEYLTLSSVVFNPDFKARSQPIAEYANSSAVYALVAGMEGENRALSSEDETGNNWQTTVGGLDANTLRANMTDRQRDTYLYLYNTEGPEKAGEYLETLGRYLQYAAWQKEEQKEAQWAKENPGLAFAQDILTLPFQGFNSAVYNITNMFYSQSPYDERLYTTRGKEVHRGVTDEMFGDFVGRGLVNWWQNYVTAQIGAGQTSMYYTPGQVYRMSEEDANKLYDMGKTAAIKSKNVVEQGLDSAYLMMLSYGLSGGAAWGLEKMGLTAAIPKEKLISFLTSFAIQGTVLTQASTAAALTTAHAKEQGEPDTVAMIKGLSNGFAEWLTETLGAEWMFKGNFASQAMLNNGHYMAGLCFLSGAAESMEEVFSLGLDTAVEAVLNGSRSEYEARRDAYEAEHPGCSEMEKTFGAGVSLAADALEQAASVFFTTGPTTAAFSVGYNARSARAASNRAQQMVNQGLIPREQRSDAANVIQRGWAVQQRMEQAAENGLTYTPTAQDVRALENMGNLQTQADTAEAEKLADEAFVSMVQDGLVVEGTSEAQQANELQPAASNTLQPATSNFLQLGQANEEQKGQTKAAQANEEQKGQTEEARTGEEQKGQEDQKLAEIREERARNRENLEKAKSERDIAQRKLDQMQNNQGTDMKTGDRVLLTNDSEEKLKADISRLDYQVRQFEQRDQMLAQQEAEQQQQAGQQKAAEEQRKAEEAEQSQQQEEEKKKGPEKFTREEMQDIFRMKRGLKPKNQYTEEQLEDLKERYARVIQTQGHDVFKARGRLDGEKVRITGIESTGENAEVTVEQDGQRSKASLDNVVFENPYQRAIYEYARGFKDLTTAKLALGAWEKTELPEYIFRFAFDAVYTAARTGTPMNQVQKMYAEMMGSNLVQRIGYVGHEAMERDDAEQGWTQEKMQKLNEAMREIRSRDTNAPDYHGVVLSRMINEGNLSADQKVTIQILDELGKRIGGKIVVLQHIKNQAERQLLNAANQGNTAASRALAANAGVIVNGEFHEGTNVLLIPLDGEKGAMLHHAGHEALHYVMDQARRQGGELLAEAQAFEREVFEQIKKNDPTYDLDMRVKSKIKEYERYGVQFKQGEETQRAREELLADAVMALMNNEAAALMMSQEHPTLLRKIVNGIKRFAAKLRAAVRALGETHTETAALMKTRARDMEKLTQKWDNLLRKAAQNQVLTRGEDVTAYSLSNETAEEDLSLVYSLAGEQAQGPYGEIVRMANEMARQGKTDAEIIKATGAIKGFRGNWWARIDNTEMRYNPDAYLGSAIRRAMAHNEMVNTTLEDLYDAEELYRAYPQLRNAQVTFRNMKENAIGAVHYENGTPYIEINTKALNRLEDQGESIQTVIEETLQHELQHIIQETEGRHTGSSTVLWEQIKAQYRQMADQMNRDMITLYDAYGDDFMSEIRMTPSYRLDEDSYTQAELDEIRQTVPEEDIQAWGDIRRFWDKYARIMNEDARTLYQNTVGEIEARSQEERGSKLNPDYRNAVAVEDYMDPETGEVRYSLLSYEDEHVNFAQQVNAYFSKRGMPSDRAFVMDNALHVAGIDEDIIMMRQGVVTKALRENAGNSRSAHADTVSEKDIRATNRNLRTPDAVIGRKDGTALVMKARDEMMPIAYAIHHAKVYGREVGEVASIHGRTDPLAGFEERYTDGTYTSVFVRINETLQELPGTTSPSQAASLLKRVLKIPQNQTGDNGKNGQNGQNRHSMTAVDREYMEAVNRGDMETAARMVEEAAKKAGYTLFGYHGTKMPTLRYDTMGYGDETDYENKRLPFTIFRPGQSGGIYVATNRDVSVGFARNYREKHPGTVMSLYVRFDNPLIVNEHVWTTVPYYYNVPTPSVMREAGYTQADLSTEEISQFAQEHGYDGVIIEGVKEGGDTQTDDIIAFRSDQLKLADPVVYDDAGNVIPLSERFNPERDDIRYSLGTETEQMAREAEQLTNRQGEQMLQVLDGGTVARYSYTSWVTDNDREKVRKYLLKQGFDKDQIESWIEDLDSIAAIIGMDRTRLDYRADRTKSAKKKNSDIYKWTIDFSTLCKKRLEYQGTRDMIQSLLPNTGLTAEDLIRLNNIMQEMGHQAPCSFCYVEGQRKEGGVFAEEFVKRYRKNHPDAEYFPNVWDVTSAAGLWKLQTEHPEAYKSFISSNNSRGVSSTKPIQLRTDYRAEIRRMGKDTIKYLNNHGGLRMQSFSDFETLHLLDMMQVVLDMTARGLKSQAYTKVPDFAWVFGMTGIKINLSLVGEGTGVDANGNLIFSSTEGMDIDEAMALRNAYSYNVGTILVGMNREHILAAMADDRIDFIIPFHRSKWTKDDMKLMVGMRNYDDFQTWQNEAHIERDAEGNIRRGNNTEENIDPTEYWLFELSGKENAERYLEECAKRGIVPKFEIFLDYDAEKGRYVLKEDGSTDGYWKLLIDYKMYDNSGRGAPQRVVTPNFNMEEAQRILDEYKGLGNGTLPVANDVVKRFLREYAEMHPDNPEAQAALERANELDETEGQTSFSMSAPVEYARDLVAVHNLDERGLLADLRMGGFPMPSIAVVDRKQGWSDYGKISVIFDRYTIDPYLNGAARVYGGDAYTPSLGSTRVNSGESAIEYLRGLPERSFRNVFNPMFAITDFQKYANLGQVHRDKQRARMAHIQPNETVEQFQERSWKHSALRDRAAYALEDFQDAVFMENPDFIMNGWKRTAANEALTAVMDYINQFDYEGEVPGETLIRVFNNSIRRQIEQERTQSGEEKKFRLLPETKENADMMQEVFRTVPETYRNAMQEAKPDELVDFEHVKLVLLPVGTSQELIDALEEAGIRYKTYTGSSYAGRTQALNDFLDEYEAERQAAGIDETDEANWESQVLFSMTGVEETDPAMQRLLAENERFRNLTAQLAAELNWQEQRSTAQLTSMANMTRLARELRDKWRVAMPIKTMAENLQKIFTGMSQAKTVAQAQAAMQALGDFSRDAILNAQTTDRTAYDQYSEARKLIGRNLRADKKTILDVFGDMSSYRKNGFGRVKLVQQGMNVDSLYTEIRDNYPGTLPEGLLNEADQLRAMLDFLDATDIRSFNPYEEGDEAKAGATVEVVSRELAMRLLRMFAEGGQDAAVNGVSTHRMSQLNGLLDRAEVVVQDTNRTMTTAGYRGMTSREYTQRIGELRRELEQRGEAVQQRNATILQLETELKEAQRQIRDGQSTIQVLRTRLNSQQGALDAQERAKLQAQIRQEEAKVRAAQSATRALQNRIDRARKTEELNKIRREILRRKASLLKKLQHPNSSRGFVPFEMEEAVVALLQAVDTEGALSGKPNKPLTAAMLQKAKNAYESINKPAVNGQPAGPMWAYYNGDLSITFDELSRTADGKRVRDLTQKELEQLRDIVAGYAAAVINEDRMFTQQRSDSLRQMGGEMIQQSMDRIQTRGEEKIHGPLATWLSQATDRGLLKPVTVFERFNGTVLGDIWKNALRPAEWKHIRNIQKAETFLNNALDTYHQHESLDADGSRKQKRQEFHLDSGRTIRLTDQELMTLYAWQKREAAMGTNHLLGGGVKLANPQRGDTMQEYRLTAADLQQFNAALNQEQKDYVDHMVEFLSTTVGEWGNAVTRELYGIEKFREGYYLPFTVAQSYVAQQPATQQDQRIKTASFTKALTDKATTTLELRGFTELWASHVEQMSDFNAFTLPMEDIVRLMNYKEGAYDDQGNFIGQGDNVRPLMERAWGANTVGYIHDFLSRLNGNSRNERGGSWLNTMMGKAKGAAVTWNISVAFQQAGAGVRALAEMDARDVLPAIATGIGQNGGFVNNYRELMKYAPIAVEKSWGYFDTNMNRGLYQRAQTTLRSRIDDAGGWLAGKGDELNWSQIWAACKHEIRRLNPNMTEEEVKQHAAERFVEVIDRTQVVDSIFQRSAFATEKGMMRGLMSFMSEPVTMYNMVVRCVDQYRDALRTKDATARRAARAKAIRTACSITLSAALTAFLKSLATGLRDRNPEKKDEDGNIIGAPSYLDKVMNAWWPNFLENLAGITTIFGNLYDNAVSNYGNSDLTTAWISNLYNAGKELLKGENADWDKVAYRSTQALSNLTGIGFAGLYRDTKAIFLTVRELMDPESLSGTAWDKSLPWDVRLRAAERNYDYSKQKGKDYYNGMLMEEYMAHGFSDDFQMIADSAIRRGANENTLMSGFKTQMKKTEPKIKQAAQALADGDMTTYERLMGEIIEGGVGQKVAYSLVNTAYNDLVKPKEEDEEPGTGAGLVEALQAEGTSTNAPAKNAGDDLLTDKATPEDVKRAVQMYKSAGMTEDKIAEKVSGKYKKPYIMATIRGDKTEASRTGGNLQAAGITQDQMKEWTTEGVFSSTKDYGLYWMIKEGRTDDAKAAVKYLNLNYPGGQTKVKERILKWAKGLKAGSYDYDTVKSVLLAIGIAESTINSTLKK